MRVVALGGSAAGPNTGAGCSGFLLTEGDTSVAIDLGPGTLLELRKHVDYRTLDAVVISHYHLDHILDVGALRFLAKYNPVPLDRKISLRVPPGSAASFAKWSDVFGDKSEGDFLESVFGIAEYDPDQPITIGEMTIRFARTVHPVPAFAMRVSSPGSGDIGYTADTGPNALDDLTRFFSGVSLLICEDTERADAGSWGSNPRGHLTPAESGRLAEDVDARLLMLTHRWEELGLERGAHEAGTTFHSPILIARPGLTVFV